MKTFRINLTTSALKLEYHPDTRMNSISINGDPLVTPKGNILQHESAELIKQVRYELEAEEYIDEDYFGLYSILSVLIDDVNNNEFIVWDKFWHGLTHDPVLATCAGPEVAFQFSRYGSLMKYLEEHKLHHPFLPQVDCEAMDDFIGEPDNLDSSYGKFNATLKEDLLKLSNIQRTVVLHSKSLTYGFLLATKRCTALEFAAAILAGDCIDARTFSDVEFSENKEGMKQIEGIAAKLLQFMALAEEDVSGLIDKGETKTCEFKETLSLDVKTQKKESYIELSAFKTIVAFLNTDGGTLLVGVKDNGAILGIEAEIEKLHKNSRDKFLLHFKNLLKSKVGQEFYPLVNYDIEAIKDREILKVDCKPSRKACFYDGKDFYVRTNPATDKLEGPKLLEYISMRNLSW
jgi:hypothetical protein